MKVKRAEPVASFRHGTQHSTQGLLTYDSGLVLESAGGYGESHLVYRARPDLSPISCHRLDDELFAEGICAASHGHVTVLSWRENLALQWDVTAGQVVRALDYDREGWGICKIGGHYYTSDGGSTLVRREHDLSPAGSVVVRLAGEPLAGLNALTAFGGNVLANIYGRDLLAEIDPHTGDVITLIDATALREREPSEQAGMLNGTCPYTAHTLLMTGKQWAWMHEARLEPVQWEPAQLDQVLAGMPRLYLPKEKRLLTRATYAREHPHPSTSD